MTYNDTRNLSSGGERKNRRRRYLINPAFQWKYTLTLSFIVFLISSGLSSVLYGLLHQQARQRVIAPETYTTNVGLVMIGFGAAFALITALGVGIWCFYVTHRICGPLFVVDRYLRELADGHIPKLRPLRRKDEFKDLFATFSHATESLRTRNQRRLQVLTELCATAQSVSRADENACHDVLVSMTKQLDELRGEMAHALGEHAQAVGANAKSDATLEKRSPVTVG